MGDGLNPGGEGVPSGSFTDGYAYLLNEDEEGARPDRGAVNFARGPQVVGHQKEQEDIGKQCSGDGISLAEEGPAGDGSDHQGDRADEDEALVGRGIGAGTEREEDQGREDQHVGEGDDVEEFRIAARGIGVADEGIGGGQNPEDHHEACEEEACDAETAMDVDASGRDQGSLGDEQEDPAGEGGSVKVNDETGQGGTENSGEIVSGREPNKDGGQHE